MNYGDWAREHLHRSSITYNGHAVSVWSTGSNDKPLALLVHGISGDHNGLLPLAVELAETYRVALIDLPGHGKSEPFSLPSAAALQAWFDGVLELVEKKLGDVRIICAHSFGCSAVISGKNLAKKKVILLNPVPNTSGMYATYSRMIMDSAHFWAHIYNWPPFIMLRGMTLAKVATRDALRRIRWTGLNSRPTFDQIVFQAGLVDIILDGAAYCDTRDGKVELIICGMYDTTSRQRDSLDMEQVFGGSKTVFLRGGHLLPIESPDRVARLIKSVVVH